MVQDSGPKVFQFIFQEIYNKSDRNPGTELIKWYKVENESNSIQLGSWLQESML